MTHPTWRVWDPNDATNPSTRDEWLAAPPPWRKPIGEWSTRDDKVEREPPPLGDHQTRATSYVATGGDEQVQRVNFALLLRRPLLVTGPPGIGKSTLAWHLGHQLGLGRPLRWEIGSRTTLQDGLYGYDPVGHLAAIKARTEADPSSADVEHFIRLGPLGTALLPTELPRVLLIDELDKASYDLPNDLLHVFEEGSYEVAELARAGGARDVRPADANGDERVTLHAGAVRCHHHPVVIITSNDERELPEAFRRRCVDLKLHRPEAEILAEVAARWFGEATQEAKAAKQLAQRDAYNDQSIDVILQALFLERTLLADADHVANALHRDPDER